MDQVEAHQQSIKFIYFGLISGEHSKAWIWVLILHLVTLIIYSV